MNKRTLAERLDQRSIPVPWSGCTLWTGRTNGHGYGIFWVNGKFLRAHRLAWECAFGAIPEGMWVLHRCDVRSCVNPNHLFLGSPQDNQSDMAKKTRGRKSKLGFPFGAVFHRDHSVCQWQARVRYRGRNYYDGYYATAEEASAAAVALKSRLHKIPEIAPMVEEP